MDKKLTLASKILSVIGICIAIYMTIYKLTSNDGMCLGSGDCSTVNASPYASVYGIPVALIGVFGYVVIFLLLQYEKANDFLKEYALLSLFGITLAGFLFTIYLVYLEFYVIHALCPFCLGSQTTMTILFGLTTARLVKQF
jgi:uncharacterized membrane protein